MVAKSDPMDAPYPDLPAYPVKHFTWREVACKHCGKFPPRHYFSMAVWSHSCRLATLVRAGLGKPLIVSSWWRCRQHPDEVRKDHVGEHVLLSAMDFKVYGPDAYLVMRTAAHYGFMEGLNLGIGVNARGPYAGRFVHVDFVDLFQSEHFANMRPWLWSY